MLGVKGMAYLDAIWEMAIKRGCQCNTDEHFAKDFLISKGVRSNGYYNVISNSNNGCKWCIILNF